jgi:hypothetical protein
VLGDDFISFIGDDIEFVCGEANVKWLLPNKTEIKESSSKFVVEKTESESKLKINNFQPRDVGLFKCVSIASIQNVGMFNLKAFCK